MYGSSSLHVSQEQPAQQTAANLCRMLVQLWNYSPLSHPVMNLKFALKSLNAYKISENYMDANVFNIW